MTAVQSHQLLYHLIDACQRLGVSKTISFDAVSEIADCTVLRITDIRSINSLHKPCLAFVILRPANIQGTGLQDSQT